jgi:hypothetical protein
MHFHVGLLAELLGLISAGLVKKIASFCVVVERRFHATLQVT